MSLRYDVVVIGSGVGGSAAVHELVGTGKSLLLLERGDFVRQEPANWDVTEVAVKRRYDAAETWIDRDGKPFSPRAYYNVGGATKFYGGSALRLRPSDFEAHSFPEGSSVAWPYRYEDLAPWYERAEALLQVHGRAGEDPDEGPRGPFPHEPLDHEPRVSDLAERLSRQGVHPLHLPIAVDQGPRGRCVKGSPCDGFPCQYRAKGDAENRLLRPVLLKKPANLTLWTGALVTRLETDGTGRRVVAAVVVRGGQEVRVEADLFILAAGAVNSAALLLRSGNGRHPNGLANSSDQVGRNFMSHNNTVILALDPFRTNPTRFQKTLAVHDFYDEGTFQCRGKVLPEMLASKPSFWLRTYRRAIAARSLDFWVMSEDLALPQNRVTVDGQGRIHLARHETNMVTHRRFVRRVQRLLGRAGLTLQFVDERGIQAIQHQCGTLRFGTDPATSVLDPWGRTHDVDNLYVWDASFFPSSAAVNPALTILAQTLRAVDHLKASVLSGR